MYPVFLGVCVTVAIYADLVPATIVGTISSLFVPYYFIQSQVDRIVDALWVRDGVPTDDADTTEPS